MYLIRKIKHILKYYLSILRNDDFIEYQSFPFDTNQQMPDGAEKVMQRCCNIIKSLNINYRITDGTVLGLYRGGEFIAHDNDIDIDIISDNMIKEIEKEFKSIGMTMGRKAIYKGKYHQIIFYTSNYTIFDIVIWHLNEDDGKLYNYSERDYERVQDAKYFQQDKLQHIEFKGEKYPMPTPVEEWLEMRYGKDWKTPKTYKGDWKEECFDMKRID